MGLFFILIAPILSFGAKLSNTELKAWNALLYHEGENFLVEDPRFYLSSKKRAPLIELERVLDELRRTPLSKKLCSFPARFYWVNKKFNVQKSLDFSKCPDLSTFLKKAPMDKLSVVFASENISIPSSMMGHIYLQLDGKVGERAASHAISFFTDAADGNFPKLVYETVFSGKDGYYALSPSYELRDNYLLNENRNIWNYEIMLNDEQRKLLALHLYELKNIRLTYFFHKFNCATLLHRVLKVAYPDIPETGRPWTTPLDVVREIHQAKIIKRQYVELANRWKIKALIFSDAVTSDQVAKVKKDGALMDSFLTKKLSLAYLGIKSEDENSDLESLKAQKIKIIKSLDPKKSLDLSSYKNPVLTKSTAQMSLSYGDVGESRRYQFKIMPASHMLEDDSSQYISESELQISTLTFGASDKRLEIDEYILYSSLMLAPHDTLSGGLSSDLALGHLSLVDHSFSRRGMIAARGKIGKTYRIQNDVDVYGLAGSSLFDGLELAPEIETGLVIRGIFDTKYILNAKTRYFSRHDFKRQDSLNGKASIDFNSWMLVLNKSLFFREQFFSGKIGLDEWTLQIKAYF